MNIYVNAKNRFALVNPMGSRNAPFFFEITITINTNVITANKTNTNVIMAKYILILMLFGCLTSLLFMFGAMYANDITLFSFAVMQCLLCLVGMFIAVKQAEKEL